ncbi:BrnA antitoxin family protein [Umezawaea endophytica]|uniref:BrnA antitoxin family protein n=1 Tax=Umezawaea endophytica TaxID=1654476 RepID=A0A9X2VT44_9PSEU|nr:BrnA antitoxin family protein [Umezawaea endophytica]MCS7482285.1 BrnA antitoxin family protein [Umezawaea endophytica]
MTMTEQNEHLPRPVEELEALAAYYDTHDTSSEMEQGEWVDPRPMRTTSLRLPSDVVDALKTLAQGRGLRYTAFVREIIEEAVNGTRAAEYDELAMINQRLTRIEEAVAEHSAPVRRARPRSGRRPPNPALRALAKQQANHRQAS